jgi:hypothetical protein
MGCRKGLKWEKWVVKRVKMSCKKGFKWVKWEKRMWKELNERNELWKGVNGKKGRDELNRREVEKER